MARGVVFADAMMAAAIFSGSLSSGKSPLAIARRTSPAGVASYPGGEVRQRLVFEVAGGLDDGVLRCSALTTDSGSSRLVAKA